MCFLLSFMSFQQNWRSEAGCGGEGGKMVQTMYAHMNK
jgi:hypothetical protein